MRKYRRNRFGRQREHRRNSSGDSGSGSTGSDDSGSGSTDSDDSNSGDTLMVRRGTTMYFNYILQGGNADFSISAGEETDQVLVGDWDANGMDILAMRRNGNTYYISNSIAEPNSGVDTFTFGRAGDEVYAGKWK